jgi:subtilase family serine protease
VLVQYRNKAGMITQATDTIVLGSLSDLRVTAVTNPPATRADGASFSVTDTTANGAGATAPASTTRYLLSKDATRGNGDVLLRGTRAVPQLAANATSRGTVTVTIPAGTPAGTYRLLACADDRKVVTESNEANNCKASATTVKVPNRPPA